MQIEDVPESELRLIIEDIRKFMRDDVDDYETNQQIIGMKHLFRGFSVKAWKGAQDDKKNYTNLTRIVNQHCMAYYCKCWKDRNEKLHDEDTQRKRVIEWQQKEYEKALNRQHPQVRKYAIENEVDAPNYTTEYLRRWIYVLREIKKRAEKYKGSDIRSYFELAK